MTLEWQEQRRRYQSGSREDKPLLPGLEEAFAEVTAERDRREAANAILVWANEHRSFTRTELIDDFVVHRFAKYHSSSLKAALKWLKSLDKLDEEPTSKGRKADARRWQVLDLAPV